MSTRFVVPQMSAPIVLNSIQSLMLPHSQPEKATAFCLGILELPPPLETQV
jgi:hypothetical protein